MTDQLENVPQELRERDQWLMWDAANDTPRRPHWRGNFHVSWSNPDDWHSFEEALAAAQERESWGIGYVMALDNEDYARGLYGCIDIDGCLVERGKPKDWVPSLAPFIDDGAYMEFSPSGDGIHIPIVGREAPEWWADSHFSDDEHEGVEYLTNKFCTFTGDSLEPAGTDVTDTDPREWLLKSHKEINGKLPQLETDDDGDSYDGDRELSKANIESALDVLDPGMPHDEWRNVAFAVHDWDSGSTGQSVFESWSSRSSKYDSSADREIEWFWSNADEGSGVTVGTLIHKAKQNGWSFPNQAKATTDGGVSATNTGSSAGRSPVQPGEEWELRPGSVVQLAVDDPLNPIGYDEEGNLTGGVRDLRASERAHYVWRLAQQTGDDDVLAQFKGPTYRYRSGVWREDDGQWARQVAGQALESAFSKGVLTELEEQIRRDRMKRPEELGAPDETIVTENGLLDLVDRSLKPVKPEHYALAKIPTEYDESAECPRWIEFVDESIDTEAERLKFQEYAGYTLWRHAQQLGKAMFLVGPTDSGKGTALKAVKQVIGSDNVASESLEDLIQTRWGTASLFGNIVNIRNEVSPSGLKNVQKFKELTGGEDEISAEFKGQDKFDFVVKQKFMFSTNEVPTVEHADEAFYNRLLFVRFPNTVDPEDQDTELLDKLKDERSGILNWMLDGLSRLLEQGQFTGERTINGKKKICDAFGGVLDRFCHNCLMVTGSNEDAVAKSDLHDLAQAYADEIDKEPEWDTQTGFSRQMGNQRGISQGQKRIDGDNPRVFKGVRVKPEVVHQFNIDVTATSGDDEEPANNSLLGYDEDGLRPGYDSSKPIGESDDVDEIEDREKEQDTLEGEPLGPHIVQYVREQQRLDHAEGVPRDELVNHLEERGAADSQISHWIEKCLNRGDISEPGEDIFRA